MKRKWKYYITFIGISIIVLMIAGCGTSAKSEKSVAEEIAQMDSFFTSNSLLMDEYNVDKRQTNKDDKTDYVWLEIKGSNEEVSYLADYKAMYVLYNDGWRLEEYEMLSSSYCALKYPEEDIVEKNIPSIFTNVQYDTQETGDNIAEYHYSGVKEKENTTETYDIELTYEYFPIEGWKNTNISENLIERKFNLIGEWAYESDRYDYYLHVVDSGSDTVKLEYALLNKGVFSYSDGWRYKEVAYSDYYISEEEEDVYYLTIASPNTVDSDNLQQIIFNDSQNAEENGFYIGYRYLTKISNNSTDDNYPKELKRAHEQLIVNNNDYSGIPEEVFDKDVIASFHYLLTNKTQLNFEPDQASDTACERYPIGSGNIAGNSVDLNLWILSNKKYPMIETLIETDFETLKKDLEKQMDVSVFSEIPFSDTFSFIIPNTDIVFTATKYDTLVDICLWNRYMEYFPLTEEQIMESVITGKERVIRYCEEGDLQGALNCIQVIQKDDDIEDLENEINAFISKYAKWLGKWTYVPSSPTQDLWIRAGYDNGLILEIDGGALATGERAIFYLVEAGEDYLVYHSDKVNDFGIYTIKYIDEGKIEKYVYNINFKETKKESANPLYLYEAAV